MKNKTVEEIIKEYLTKNEFHGLYNSDVDCACKLDDLFPCGGVCTECTVGYLQPSDENSEYELIGDKKHENNGDKK